MQAIEIDFTVLGGFPVTATRDEDGDWVTGRNGKEIPFITKRMDRRD